MTNYEESKGEKPDKLTQLSEYADGLQSRGREVLANSVRVAVEALRSQRELTEKYKAKYSATSVNERGEIIEVKPSVTEAAAPVDKPKSESLESRVAETPVVAASGEASGYARITDGERVEPQPAPAEAETNPFEGIVRKKMLKLYGEGKTAKEIGKELGMSDEEVGSKLRSYRVERRTQRIVNPQILEDKPAEAQDVGRKTDALPTPEEIAKGDTRPLPNVEEAVGYVETDEAERSGINGVGCGSASDLPGPRGIKIPGRKSLVRRAAEYTGCLALVGAAIVGTYVVGKNYLDNRAGNDSNKSGYSDVDKSDKTAGGKLEPMDKRDFETKTELENKAEADRKALEAKRLADEAAAEAKRKADEEKARLGERKGSGKRVSLTDFLFGSDGESLEDLANEGKGLLGENGKKEADYGAGKKLYEAVLGAAKKAYEGAREIGAKAGQAVRGVAEKVVRNVEEVAKKAEAKRIADEKAAEEAKIAAERETKRIADEKAAEEARILRNEAVAKAIDKERAERNRAKGKVTLDVGGISAEDSEFGFGGRVGGNVRAGGFNGEGYAFGKATPGNVVAGISARGADTKRTIVGELNAGYRGRNSEESSNSESEHDEGVFFRQSDRENSSQRFSEWFASGRVLITPVERVSIGVDYSHKDTRDRGKNLTETDVTFPDNPELQPIHISSDVRSEAKTLEDVVTVRAGFDAGIVRPFAVGRAKNVAWGARASNNGAEVVNESGEERIYSLGAGANVGNESFTGRALVLRNFGDVEASQEWEGAANVVVPLGKVAVGVGGERANGVTKGRALFFVGDASKNLSKLSGFLETLEDNSLFPDRTLDDQKFLEICDGLADAGMDGIVVQAGVGGKSTDNINDFELGASVSSSVFGEDLRGASITGVFVKNGKGRRIHIEPRVGLGDGFSLGAFFDNEKDAENGERNSAGLSLGKKF